MEFFKVLHLQCELLSLKQYFLCFFPTAGDKNTENERIERR